MLAHVPSFGRNPRGSPDFLAYAVPKACMHVLGTGVPRCLGVARSAFESQSSAGLRMQPYPRAPDLIRPGHLHGTGSLSARAIDTGFPIVVWRLCLGLGSAVTPPFLAGVYVACVWARVWALPRHFRLGFVVRAFGVGFGGNPATAGWGLGGVCLDTGFGCAPPFLAWVRGVCVWVWVSPAARFFRSWCWGVWPLACAPSVSRQPLVGLPVAWGCAWLCLVGFLPPLLLFFPSFGGAGVWFLALSCRGFVVFAAACPGLGPLCFRPPFHFHLGCVRFFFRWAATSPLGCAPACPRCPFLRPSGGRVIVVGCRSPLGVARLGRVVLRDLSGGPVGVAFGVAWLGGLLASCGVGARLCGCVTVCCAPFFFFFSGGRAFVVGRGFPPFCVVCLLFGGGGFLFLPLPSLGWCTHSSAFGVVDGVAVCAAIGWAVPRLHGSDGFCTRLAWWPVLLG